MGGKGTGYGKRKEAKEGTEGSRKSEGKGIFVQHLPAEDRISQMSVSRSTAFWWRLGLMVSVVGDINEVTVGRARLVLGWVTVFDGHTTLVSLPSHLRHLSLLPSVGWENEYQPRAVTFCSWGDNGRLWKWCAGSRPWKRR